MGAEPDGEAISNRLAVSLVVLPIVGGGLLFVLFESGTIHRLGLFTAGAGVLVGVALLLLRTE